MPHAHATRHTPHMPHVHCATCHMPHATPHMPHGTRHTQPTSVTPRGRERGFDSPAARRTAAPTSLAGSNHDASKWCAMSAWMR
eukprot:7377203-Prymnesium_polylepis.1